MVKTTKKTQVKTKNKKRVTAHKSKMLVNRESIIKTVVAYLPPLRDSEGKKTGFGELVELNTETKKLSTPKTIKMLYGERAETFKNIIEVITPTTYAKGIESEYSYKYVVTKAEFLKQNNKK